MFKRFIINKFTNLSIFLVSKKIFSFFLLCSYLTNFVIAPVYAASADVMLPLPPRELQQHSHIHTPTQVLPALKIPLSQETNFQLKVKDASFGTQKCLLVSLTQGDQLLDNFRLESHVRGDHYFCLDVQVTGQATRLVQPILSAGDILQGWSWDLSRYGLSALQIGTNGVVVIDQMVIDPLAVVSIAAPSINLGVCKAKRMQLQSPEVIVHKEADIEALEINPDHGLGSLIIGHDGTLKLKGLSFHGNLLNLGNLHLDHDPASTILNLQNSKVCNWGTVSSATDLRLAGLGLFENFGHVAGRSVAVGALQVLNHKTISAKSTHIFAQNLIVNDAEAIITGHTELQVVSLTDMANHGTLKGSRVHVVSQQFTGNGRVVAAAFKFFTSLWDGLGHFKAETLEFTFQKLLSKAGKASFEGGSKLSLVSPGDNSYLRLATLKGDNVHLDLLGTDVFVDKLDFSQGSTAKTRNLTLRNVTPGLGAVDWQAEQGLELPAELVKFRNNASLKAKTLRFQAMQSPKTLKVDVSTLSGKAMHAMDLDLTFAEAVASVVMNPTQRSISDTIKLMQLGPQIILGKELDALSASVSARMDDIMHLPLLERAVLLDELEVNLAEARTQVLSAQEASNIDSRFAVVSASKKELYDHFKSERDLIEMGMGGFVDRLIYRPGIILDSIRSEQIRKKAELKQLTEEYTLIEQQIAQNTQKIQLIDKLQHLMSVYKKRDISDQLVVGQPQSLYEYVAQQELRLTHTGELFENKGHLQGDTIITTGKGLHNFGTVLARKKAYIGGGFVNTPDGIVESRLLELTQPDRILSNAGKITVKALHGVEQIQNTGHLEILRDGIRLRSFHNSGYADLGIGLWFFEDFTNEKDAVCKLGKRSEIVKYQNLGTLYADSGLRAIGSIPEGLGRLIVNGQVVWYVLPGDAPGHHTSGMSASSTSSIPAAVVVEELKSAVELSDALKAEDAYLTDVSKANPLASFIGFLALSDEHSKQLFRDFSKEETRAQWTRVLSRLGHSHDPIAIAQLLDNAKALLWNHQEVLIGAKALKDYLDIPATITAMDEAIVDILTGAWGLGYLSGISGENTAALETIAAKAGTSFYQQQRTVKQVYKTVYDAFAKHRVQNQALDRVLLQKHFVNTIGQISGGYFKAQDNDVTTPQLILHPPSSGSSSAAAITVEDLVASFLKSGNVAEVDLVALLQKSEFVADSVQVNYPADFRTTADLSFAFPLILRTKKFWNNGKLSGDLMVISETFANGVDNDHLGVMTSEQGAVSVYCEGQIDNRFGRIFSRDDGALETLGGNILVGAMKEVKTLHTCMPAYPSGGADYAQNPYYQKKSMNGAFVSGNGQLKLASYFGDLCVDYGEVFANDVLKLRGNLIRNLSGAIKTCQSVYFDGDRYLSTRPDQQWYPSYSPAGASDNRWLYKSHLLESGDPAKTQAGGDIWLNVSQVDDIVSDIWANGGIYKFQELIAGYGKNFVPGIAPSVKLENRWARHKGFDNYHCVQQWWDQLYSQVSATMRAGEHIAIKGSDDIVTITGSMSAGARVTIDVDSILTKFIGTTRSESSASFLVIDLHEVAKAQAGGFFAIQDSGRVDSLYPITSKFSWQSSELAHVGSKETSAVSEVAFEFALQQALAQRVGHLSFEQQSSTALLEYLFRNSQASGKPLSLDELVATATKPLVAMVARQVKSTMFSVPHLLVPPSFVNPYQASGDVYGRQVRLLTSGDQEHESSRVVAKELLEARAKGKMKRRTAKYTEIYYQGDTTIIAEKAKPQQQFICEMGPLTAISTLDYHETGCTTQAGGDMLRGSTDANAHINALELHTTSTTHEESSSGLFSGPKTTVTISDSSSFVTNRAVSGGISKIIAGDLVQASGAEEHAAQDLVYESKRLELDAAVGVQRTQTTSTSSGAFSKTTKKSLMEMPVFVRNILSAQTIKFVGQESAQVRGTAVVGDTVEDHTQQGVKFGPTIGTMRYEMSTSSRQPMATSNCGTRGGQELMEPTSLSVRRIVRSASLDDLTGLGEMEFISCVWQDRQRVEIQGHYKESIHVLRQWQESWAHHHQVVPQAAIIVMGIALSIATQGMGTTTFLASLGSTGSTMASVGLRYLISTAATSFASTGDLGATARQLMSDSTLRGLAISVASAGITKELGSMCGVTDSLDLPNLALKHTIQSTVDTTLNVAINGQNPGDALKQGITSAVVNTAMAYGAGKIGDLKSTGDIDSTTQKALHGFQGAMGGAVTGVITGQDIGKSALSGGSGAFMAHSLAEMMDSPSDKDPNLTEKQHQEQRQYVAKVADLVTTLFGYGVGLDPFIIHQMASNALENNFLGNHSMNPIAPLVKAVEEGMTPKDGEEATQEQKEYKQGQDKFVMKNLEQATRQKGVDLSEQEYVQVVESSRKLYAFSYCSGKGTEYALDYGLTTASICTGGTAGIVVGAADTAYGIATGKTKVPETVQDWMLHTMGIFPGMKLMAGAVKLDKLATHASSSSAASTTLAKQPVAGRLKAMDDFYVEKIHGCSRQYVGDTHVYVIRGADGRLYKVGESMQGVSALGQSKRAQVQVEKLKRLTGQEYRAQIRAHFGTKAEARDWETRLIERYRSMHGQDLLPGNKGNR